MFVVTADQVGSRRGPDLVPAAVQALAEVGAAGAGRTARRPTLFERTAGDELQGVLETAEEVVAAVTALLRTGHFRVGVGIGPVQLPLPQSPRAGRGPAFIAARAAVEAAAHTGPIALRYAAPAPAAAARHTELAEHALVLLADLLTSRSAQGWQVCDLLAAGASQRQAAAALQISPSAVSQRLRRAGWAAQQRAVALAEHHLDAADAAGSHLDAADAAGRHPDAVGGSHPDAGDHPDAEAEEHRDTAAASQRDGRTGT